MEASDVKLDLSKVAPHDTEELIRSRALDEYGYREIYSRHQGDADILMALASCPDIPDDVRTALMAHPVDEIRKYALEGQLKRIPSSEIVAQLRAGVDLDLWRIFTDTENPEVFAALLELLEKVENPQEYCDKARSLMKNPNLQHQHISTIFARFKALNGGTLAVKGQAFEPIAAQFYQLIAGHTLSAASILRELDSLTESEIANRHLSSIAYQLSTNTATPADILEALTCYSEDGQFTADRGWKNANTAVSNRNLPGRVIEAALAEAEAKIDPENGSINDPLGVTLTKILPESHQGRSELNPKLTVGQLRRVLKISLALNKPVKQAYPDKAPLIEACRGMAAILRHGNTDSALILDVLRHANSTIDPVLLRLAATRALNANFDVMDAALLSRNGEAYFLKTGSIHSDVNGLEIALEHPNGVRNETMYALLRLATPASLLSSELNKKPTWRAVVNYAIEHQDRELLAQLKAKLEGYSPKGDKPNSIQVKLQSHLAGMRIAAAERALSQMDRVRQIFDTHTNDRSEKVAAIAALTESGDLEPEAYRRIVMRSTEQFEDDSEIALLLAKDQKVPEVARAILLGHHSQEVRQAANRHGKATIREEVNLRDLDVSELAIDELRALYRVDVLTSQDYQRIYSKFRNNLLALSELAAVPGLPEDLRKKLLEHPDEEVRFRALKGPLGSLATPEAIAQVQAGVDLASWRAFAAREDFEVFEVLISLLLAVDDKWIFYPRAAALMSSPSLDSGAIVRIFDKFKALNDGKVENWQECATLMHLISQHRQTPGRIHEELRNVNYGDDSIAM